MTILKARPRYGTAIAQLPPVVNIGYEDHKKSFYYIEKVAYGKPDIPEITPVVKRNTYPSESDSLHNNITEYADNNSKFIPIEQKEYSPTPLPFSQIAPELVAFANNSVEGVQGRSYTPRLYQPYEVSFQDQLNQNQSDFNGLEKIVPNNPEYLSTLAAKKYQANENILGNEFRANQRIANNVINENTQLSNKADLINLKLADQQYVRQATAKSKTEAENNAILNSIASKLAQNNLINKQMAAYSNLYPYYQIDNETGGVNYVGPSIDESGAFPPDIRPLKKKVAANGALVKAYKNK